MKKNSQKNLFLIVVSNKLKTELEVNSTKTKNDTMNFKIKNKNSPRSSPLRKDGSFDKTSETDDYDLANEEVEKILGTTKPKNIGEGLTSGIGYILRGAIGACGAVVVSTLR